MAEVHKPDPDPAPKAPLEREAEPVPRGIPASTLDAPLPPFEPNGYYAIHLTAEELDHLIEQAGQVSLEDWPWLEKADEDDLERIHLAAGLLLKLRRVKEATA